MPDKISRRDFIIKSAAGAVISGAAISFLDLEKLFAKSAEAVVNKKGGDIIIKLSDPQNAELAKVGGSVSLDDENLLVRVSKTQFLAVNLICRHKGCTVDLTGDQFICPCHGSEYDITGKVTKGPAKLNLKTWQTYYDPDKGIVTVKMEDNSDNKTGTGSDSTKADTTKHK